ncbi:hypothetical protein GCM10027610_094520 [Dactylosporangium cerinum]
MDVEKSDRAARTRAVQALAGLPCEPGIPKPDPILVADNVVRRFGGLTAVDVKHVEVQRGSITALIGPNGAGKTTFFNLLTGFDAPDEGSWTFNGRSLSGVSAHKVARSAWSAPSSSRRPCPSSGSSTTCGSAPPGSVARPSGARCCPAPGNSRRPRSPRAPRTC